MNGVFPANETGQHTFAVYAITKHGITHAETILAGIPDADLFVSKKFIDSAPSSARELSLPMGPTLQENFSKYDCHIFIISVGAVVRMIKDLMKDKKTDPAVICVDDAAKFSVCVLSGHVGRGNEFTEKTAAILGAVPVVTTASDRLGTLPVDILGRELGWILDDPSRNVTAGCAAVVNERPTAFVHEAGEADFWPLSKELPSHVKYFTNLDEVNPDDFEMILAASDRDFKASHPDHFQKAVIYRPKSLVLGIGCDKDTPSEVIEKGILHHLNENRLDIRSVKECATIDLKKNEPGLLAVCEKYGWNITAYPAAELDSVSGIENPSDVVKKYTGSRTVAEGACLLLSGAQKLLLPKKSYKMESIKYNMTLSAARIPFAKRKAVKAEIYEGVK